MNDADVFAINRPSGKLLQYYLVKALLSGPFALILLPLLLCRYVSLRYRFDAEGVRMCWGVLFRKEVNLTYARVQDIHLTSGVIQRWLGLADIQIQTASGKAEAEMVIEGLLEAEALRSFLYTKMRGYKPQAKTQPAGVPDGDECLVLLKDAVEELKGARAALEKLAASSRVSCPPP